MRVVIIGGVAGGMSAATRLRRLDEQAEIVVIERSGHVSYANCGLPYYIGGVIPKESDLLLQTPETLHRRFRIDVRVNSEALAIHPETKAVKVRNLGSGEEYELGYDKLILSPGASPVVPPIPGIERALTLRTVEDTHRIADVVRSGIKSATIIGGGFIGVEMAENLVHRGVKTTLVEALDQVLTPLDPEMATLVAKELQVNGVGLKLRKTVVAINADSVVLDDGEEISSELVILAIGVRPETNLARSASLLIGPKNGIMVNLAQQTSNPDIYAVGDAVEKYDALSHEAVLIPLANLANRHGRIVADHIVGKSIRDVESLGTAIVKVFGLQVATTGWNEKRLRAAGIEHTCIHTHPNSHAGYYPGAEQMSLKLLMDPKTGSILGAQGVGREGIDKRIDVIATAMRGGLTAPELADLELSYAPPFGSAKDPVNMLGYVADNLFSGASRSCQWSQIGDYVADGYEFIDVRTNGEFDRGTIPGARNIPVDELRDRIGELTSKKVLVTCQVGQRGHVATMMLRNLGFDAVNLDGGYLLWSNSPAAKQGAGKES